MDSNSSAITNQILNSVQALPPAPATALKLMALIRRPDRHMDDVVKIIEYDPVITSKLLKLCNSPFIASRGKVGSMHQAIFLLGYAEVTRVVWQLSVGTTLANPLRAYGLDANALWHHSITTAVAAQKLRELSPKPLEDSTVAFTAGLLHDMGKVVMNQCLLPVVSQVRDCIEKEGMLPIEAERHVLGVDHAHIGGCLLQRWNMPQPIVEAVSNHHLPPRTPAALSAVVHLANSCAHCMSESCGVGSMASQFHADAVETLDLQPDDVERTMMFVNEKSDEIWQLLSAL